jgi:hypothetical protein
MASRSGVGASREVAPGAVGHHTQRVTNDAILEGAAEARARALVDQAMLLIGDALRFRLEPHLQCTFGPDWSRQVTTRNGRFGRRDLASYAQGLLGERELRETRKEFREALGLRMSPVLDQRLRAALRVRNTFAHPDGPAALKGTQNDIGQLLVLAKTLNLDCISRLEAIAQQAGELADGDSGLLWSPEQVQEWQRRAEQAVTEVEASRQQAMRAEAAREQAHDQLVRTEGELEAVRTAQHDAEVRAETFRQQAADAAANSARAAQLERERDRAAEQAAAQAELRAKAERQVAALRDRLEAHDRQVEAAAQQAEDAEIDRDDLTGSVAFDVALTQRPMDTPDDLPAQIEAVLARLMQPDSQVATEQESPFPEPGQQWPFPRGREVWRLSGADRALTSADGLWSLDELLGPELADELVESFLEIRPEGGRIWVDEDGDAVTYIDKDLIYLGCIKPDPTDPRWNPPIGTPCLPGNSRRYTVTRTGVKKHDGTRLAAVIDSARAQAVLSRLLAVRPKGGAFRVNSAGAVTTYLDGGWVFAGRVQPEEWFPEDVFIGS